MWITTEGITLVFGWSELMTGVVGVLAGMIWGYWAGVRRGLDDARALLQSGKQAEIKRFLEGPVEGKHG